jgi:hypothetical protein
MQDCYARGLARLHDLPKAIIEMVAHWIIPANKYLYLTWRRTMDGLTDSLL